jgi:hypothetical protein
MRRMRNSWGSAPMSIQGKEQRVALYARRPSPPPVLFSQATGSGRFDPFTMPSAIVRCLRILAGLDRQFRARLHAGYSLAASLRFKPVHAAAREFKTAS